MTRTKISTIIGKRINAIVGTERNYLAFLDERGVEICQVSMDDVFDCEGNRFEIDVDL